ncbi:MAG: site-specific integrase, partial [Raoultibacter sp.]
MDDEDIDLEDEQALSLLDGYIEHLQIERGVSQNTVRAYRIDILDYLRWAQRSEIAAVQANHRQLRLYLGELDRAQYSRTTINRRLSALRGFFSWMAGVGAIESDPADVLQGPRQPRALPYTIQPADMAKILCVYSGKDIAGNTREQSPVDMRNQAILELFYACGARVAEASGLLLSNVDLDHNQVKLIGKG